MGEFKRGKIVTLHEAIENPYKKYFVVRRLIGRTTIGDSIYVLRDMKSMRYRNVIESLIMENQERKGKFVKMKLENLKKIMRHNNEAKQEYIYRVKNKLKN